MAVDPINGRHLAAEFPPPFDFGGILHVHGEIFVLAGDELAQTALRDAAAHAANIGRGRVTVHDVGRMLVADAYDNADRRRLVNCVTMSCSAQELPPTYVLLEIRPRLEPQEKGDLRRAIQTNELGRALKATPSLRCGRGA